MIDDIVSFVARTEIGYVGVSGEYHVLESHAMEFFEKFGAVSGLIEVADNDDSMRLGLQITYECYQVLIKLLSWVWFLNVCFPEHGPLLSIDRQWSSLWIGFTWFVDCYNVDHALIFGS